MVALIGLVCGTGLKTCRGQKTRYRVNLFPVPRIERKQRRDDGVEQVWVLLLRCRVCSFSIVLYVLYKPETETSVIPVIWLYKLTTSKKCWKAGISQQLYKNFTKKNVHFHRKIIWDKKIFSSKEGLTLISQKFHFCHGHAAISSVFSFFLRISQYICTDLHKYICIFTSINIRTQTYPFKHLRKIELINLEINELTTDASLLTDTSHTTERIALLNPRINSENTKHLCQVKNLKIRGNILHHQGT
jgi:hypothetical protein